MENNMSTGQILNIGEAEECSSPAMAPIARDRFELLIMTEAGKPIYSLSKREDVVTLMPLCCSLFNYAKKAQKETISSIRTSDNLIINFSLKSPLFMVMIHDAIQDMDPVIFLDQVEAQMISILTAKTLRSILKERPTFDLKKLIYGSEKLIDALASTKPDMIGLDWPQVQAFLVVNITTSKGSNQQNQHHNPNFGGDHPSSGNNLSGFRPHRLSVPMIIMPPSARDNLHSVLSNVIADTSDKVVFSLLFQVVKPEGPMIYDPYNEQGHEDRETDLDLESTLEGGSQEVRNSSSELGMAPRSFKLVTLCNHHNRHKLESADIHIVQALLNGTRGQLETVDFLWMPVCLPRFNEDAFMHTYMAFMNQKKLLSSYI